MKFKDFLFDKIFSITIITLFELFVLYLLFICDVDKNIIFVILFSFVISNVFACAFEYFRERNFYINLFDCLKSLDKKFLLSEVIDEPNFLEGKILYECEKITNKSINDEISKHKRIAKDYVEYLETWIHEIKTPIASSKLIIENNSNDVTENILEEIKKIEYFIEQSLFYSRSSSVYNDYFIKKIHLSQIVNSVIKKNSKNLIAHKIKIERSNLSLEVLTDKKWLEFIINQVINNSMNYIDKKPVIKIYAEKYCDIVKLTVEDNGVGISDKDIDRVFEKGFTGENSRKNVRSTGMGLYICKKLADKLGLDLKIYSKRNLGTKVEIIFSKGGILDI